MADSIPSPHRSGRQLLRDPRFIGAGLTIALLALAAAAPDLLGGRDPFDCSLDRSLVSPSLSHPFGFDLQGCDYYTRILHGARSSLVVGTTVGLLTALVGIAIGMLAGYYEGFFDAIVGRLGDAVLAVPLIFGGAVVLSFIEQRGILQVTSVLVILGWPPMARLVRTQVLQIKDEPFVQAARSLGASDGRLLFKHILPNALWPIVVYATSYVAIAITAEAILTFFGVGLQLPAISWGLMLSQIRIRVLDHPHLMIPAIFLSAAVAAFVFLGEALRSLSDPRGR